MRDDAGERWVAAVRAGDIAAAHAISASVLAARDPATRDDPALPYHLRWVWDGRPFDGRDVLVRCYHGLGDVLQFARFLAPLARRARSVALEAPPALLPLLTGLGADELIPFETAHPAAPREVDIEIMELFLALAVDLAPPARLPLIAPARLPDDTIALCWRAGDWDGARSVRLDDLLTALPSDRPLLSLQRGAAAAEARPPRFLNPADDDADPCRTAALILGAKAIVTVDTMVAHLAGTLGAETHLLLRREADWRWMRDRDDTPWYPSVRLYRQSAEGDWSAPLARLAAALRSPAAG